MKLSTSPESITKYNIKNEFLERYNNTDDYDLYSELLHKINAYEQLFDRDFLFFTKSMLISFTESEFRKPEQFAVFTRLLKDYYSFYGKQPPIIEAVHFITENLRQHIVANESELRTILDSVFLPDEERTLDVMRKACLILLYYGINKNDIPSVKKEQVSDTLPCILYPDGGVFRENIPECFMDTLRLCKVMTFAVSTNQQYTSSESRNRPLQDSGYLIRAEATTSKSPMVATAFIDKIFARSDFGMVNKDLNSSRLIESGFYSWIKARKGESFRGEFSDFKVLYEEYFGKLTSRYRIYHDNYQIWRNIT